MNEKRHDTLHLLHGGRRENVGGRPRFRFFGGGWLYCIVGHTDLGGILENSNICKTLSKDLSE